MENARRLPPTWLMGLTNAPFGLTGGFCAVVIPELLAAHGIPAGHVAAIAAAILSPGFWIFAVSPMLDAWLSRRTYAVIFGSLTAVAIAVTVAHPDRPGLVEAVMLPGFAAAMLYQGSVGGWMGSLVDKKEDGRLGVWFAVSNLGAGGLMMILAGQLVSRLAPALAGMLMGSAVLVPMLLFLVIPSPPARRRPARESFGRFNRELVSLLKQRSVLMALALFLFPAASFALTNVLGGTGADFSANDRTVSLFAGVGSSLAGIAGSFLLFPLARRFPLRPVYLAIGIVGAIFTLSLLTLPRQPWSFGVAITGENLFQALAFATGNGIAFEVIGPDNPFAATLFTVLLAASNMPITYMQLIDGKGYDWMGLTGSIVTDAGVSIVACLTLAWMLFRWRGRPDTALQPIVPLPENAD
ncbi:MFS transporter [Telmatobacter sp. DSM 110680]|uniref:MFS transporter n=1 Tax=Telmatobacter sp. DSM 110680 TaxID=3036704 RepID=A0AAU7DP82_9BACT